MEVKIENNPVIHRMWKEWSEKDRELSEISKEERLNYCKNYQWVYPKQTKRMVELESLYSSVRHKWNREEFYRWFYVVAGYVFSRVHFGDNSYYQYKMNFKKQYKRDKCTSDDFPAQVLLSLAMMGYITKLDKSYSYTNGGNNNHGYHYLIDKDKLKDWGYTSSVSGEMPEWEMSHTSTLSFEEEGIDYDRLSWSLYPEWLSERQYQSISSVEVLQEGVKSSSKWLFSFDEYKYYYSLSDEEKDELMKDWVSYQKLRDLSCGIIGRCVDDSDKPDGKGYAGRFYSPMTNMRSEHRHKFLRLDGELVTEVDISSAQPTFLGIMMYRKNGVISEWLRQALDGTFYEWIREKTNSTEDRKTIKKWMMQFLYSCYQPNKKKNYDKPHKPTYENKKTEDPFLCFQQRLNRFLLKSEPAIFNMIDWYKRNPEYREDKENKKGKGKWCSKLSYELVKMEVEYMKKCLMELPEDMKFWTIHDCLCVKESDSLEVKSLMEKVSREMYGEDITLRLKRENTSEEYS